MHSSGGAAEGRAGAGEEGIHRRGRDHHQLSRRQELGHGASHSLHLPGVPAENRPGDGYPGGQGGLPYRRIQGGRLLPEREENFPAGIEPAPVLAVCGLRCSGAAPAGGRADSEAGACLRGGAHFPLSPEPVFYRRMRPAGTAGVHGNSRLAAHRRRKLERSGGGKHPGDGAAIPQPSQHRPLGRAHQRKSGR